MSRSSFRVGLLVTTIVSAVAVLGLLQLGEVTEPEPDCRARLPLVDAALDLTDNGETGDGRSLLTDRLGAQVGDDPAPLDPADKRCIEWALDRIGNWTVADQVVRGAAVLADGIPGVDDHDGDPASLPGEVRDAIRFLLWFVPVVLAILWLRELLIGRRDRRPGPVTVKTVTVTGDGLDGATLQSEIAHQLSGIELDPAPRTAGGIGEIVVPVVESASKAPSALATAMTLVREVALPTSGFEADCTVAKVDDGFDVIVAVRTARDGQTLTIARHRVASRQAIAPRAASAVYFAVHRHRPVSLRTPMWSIWSDATALEDFSTAMQAGSASSEVLEKIVDREPGTLAALLQLAKELYREAEAAAVAASDTASGSAAPEPEPATSGPARTGDDRSNDGDRSSTGADPADHLVVAARAVRAAAAAVQRAPRLVETRAQLALAVGFGAVLALDALPAERERSADLVAQREAAMEQVRALGDVRPRVVRRPWRNRKRWDDDLDVAANWYDLSIRLCRRARWNVMLPSVWWRYAVHPRLRRTMPGRTLRPFAPDRRAAIHNLESIEVFMQIRRRGAGPASEQRLARMRARLTWLRIRAWSTLSARKGFTYYNIALCYHVLADPLTTGSPEWTRLRRRERAALHSTMFGLRSSIRRSHVDDLFGDEQLRTDLPGLRTWLRSVGLPDEKSVETVDPESLAAAQAKVADERVDVWRKLVREQMQTTRNRAIRQRRMEDLDDALADDAEKVAACTPVDLPRGTVRPPTFDSADAERVRDALLQGDPMDRSDRESLALTRLGLWAAYADDLAGGKSPHSVVATVGAQ